jgi:hypothetical protein
VSFGTIGTEVSEGAVETVSEVVSLGEAVVLTDTVAVVVGAVGVELGSEGASTDTVGDVEETLTEVEPVAAVAGASALTVTPPTSSACAGTGSASSPPSADTARQQRTLDPLRPMLRQTIRVLPNIRPRTFTPDRRA